MENLSISPELREDILKAWDWVVKAVKRIVVAIKRSFRKFIKNIGRNVSPRFYYIYINTKSTRIKKKARKKMVLEIYRAYRVLLDC